MTKLTVSTTIQKPLEYIRERRNNPDHIVHRCFASDDWCCPRASNDLNVGGLLIARMEAKDGSFGFDMIGQYSVVEPMNTISYTMGSYERDTDFVDAGRVVDIVFEDLGTQGVRLTETFDAEEVHSHDLQIAGRQAILENFKKYVETH
ncbi:MAG TPA: SRPBCC domain-containing protein [Candidatus Absconditabacterales bacterium]|nr:SRPBCC domain-containing protein [Candidatus Absconditabacterales bacterium]HNG97677.1 SRPBCC domain-containing protein [Candidatus Absconditabacterales bacterium]